MLNDLQKTQIRRAVSIVRRLQGDQREINERIRTATRLRRGSANSGGFERVEKAKSELAEIRESEISRIGNTSRLIAQAEKHLAHCESELRMIDQEIATAMKQQAEVQADLAAAQPIAEKLISLIDLRDPIRELFDWVENPSFEAGLR